MAGRKLPILPSNPTPTDDDLMYGVDVSDTSESAAGTSKQSTFLNVYTYILGKLSAALRLIPSGGTTGQVLAKSSNTNYEVEWATAGGGSAAVTADAPILGDGTGGDHLRLDFDATPTDSSSKLVNSNGVYDFAMTVINITNAALNTACSGGTVNTKAMYRVTNAVGGIVRVWGKSATQVSCAGFQEGSSDGSTYLEGAWGNYDLGNDIFTPFDGDFINRLGTTTFSSSNKPIMTLVDGTITKTFTWVGDLIEVQISDSSDGSFTNFKFERYRIRISGSDGTNAFSESIDSGNKAFTFDDAAAYVSVGDDRSNNNTSPECLMQRLATQNNTAQRIAPSSGDTVAWDGMSDFIFIDNPALLATLTIDLSTNATYDRAVRIRSRGGVTALTLTTTGFTVSGTLSSLTALISYMLYVDVTNSTVDVL